MGKRAMTETSRPAPSGSGETFAMRRRRPRAFEEWKALVAWGRLPPWEVRSTGYQLRREREAAGLTQTALAKRLGVSQQAIARAERWDSNPTVRLLESWARALGARLEIEIRVQARVDPLNRLMALGAPTADVEQLLAEVETGRE